MKQILSWITLVLYLPVIRATFPLSLAIACVMLENSNWKQINKKVGEKVKHHKQTGLCFETQARIERIYSFWTKFDNKYCDILFFNRRFNAVWQWKLIFRLIYFLTEVLSRLEIRKKTLPQWNCLVFLIVFKQKVNFINKNFRPTNKLAIETKHFQI